MVMAKQEISAELQKLTMSVERASELLGISRGAGYRAARTGELPTIRFGKKILIPTAKLRELLGIKESTAQ